VRDGAEHPNELWFTDDAIAYDSQHPYEVAQMMAKKTNGSIGVLGLSYKRDLKVHVLSPALKIIDGLKDEGVEVKVFDPYYTEDEVMSITSTPSFKYPDELSQFGGLIIVPPHRLFSQTPKKVLLKSIRAGQVILDNEGIWKKWRDDFISMGIDYHCVGDKGWYVSD
jgi:UDP-N-acetyl-D-mannosaminuronate dehydrogenase